MAKNGLSSPMRGGSGISRSTHQRGAQLNHEDPPFDKPMDSGPDTIPTVFKIRDLKGEKEAPVSSPMGGKKGR